MTELGSSFSLAYYLAFNNQKEDLHVYVCVCVCVCVKAQDIEIHF